MEAGEGIYFIHLSQKQAFILFNKYLLEHHILLQISAPSFYKHSTSLPFPSTTTTHKPPNKKSQCNLAVSPVVCRAKPATSSPHHYLYFPSTTMASQAATFFVSSTQPSPMQYQLAHRAHASFSPASTSRKCKAVMNYKATCPGLSKGI